MASMTGAPYLVTLAAVVGAIILLVAGQPTAAIALLVLAVLGAAWSAVDAAKRNRALGELRGADESLSASEQKFAGILSIAADAIITVDGRQNIMHFNWGAEQIFGYTEKEVVGQPLNILLPDRFRATHVAYVEGFAQAPETARRMGHRREIFGRRKSGVDFPAEAAISKLSAGGEMLFTVVLRDITDRKRSEEEQRFLASASALLSSSLDMDETLVSIAEIARPTLADACIVELGEDGADRRWVASGHDDDDVELRLEAAAGSATSYGNVFAPLPTAVASGPYVAYDAGGSTARGLSDRERAFLKAVDACSVAVVPLNVADRSLGRMLLITTGGRHFNESDLALATELGARCSSALESARLYEAARRATRARDEVLGVVSHDLRNPISAISMCARVLTETPPDDQAERQKMLGAITQATEWTSRLIQDLLDVTSIEAGRLSIERSYETVDTLVQSAVSMIAGEATERRHEISVHVAPGQKALHADAGRIVQVLANLLGNAVKFTPAGGRIELYAEAEDSEVRFSVSDNGPGIPTAESALVFERFWHSQRGSRRKSSGLGLAIARGIVEAHGGRIWVESASGAGSTFRFTIPQRSDLIRLDQI